MHEYSLAKVQILNSFGISQSEFIECIDVLNRHEIVDLPQNTYAKIRLVNRTYVCICSIWHS